MPLFSTPQNQDGSAWEPQAADSRLAKTAGADPAGVFTSDLSVPEYVLLGEAGFEPLGFVVGSGWTPSHSRHRGPLRIFSPAVARPRPAGTRAAA
jgi:hypothetical protein